MNVAGRKKRELEDNKRRISEEHKRQAANIARLGIEALISVNKIVDDRFLNQLKTRQYLHLTD